MSSTDKDESYHQIRLNTCKECPSLFKPTMQCKECGCFMRIKTRIKSAQCPIGKW